MIMTAMITIIQPNNNNNNYNKGLLAFQKWIGSSMLKRYSYSTLITQKHGMIQFTITPHSKFKN